MNPQRNYRILLVEDEPGDARLMQLAIKRIRNDVEVSLATDGEAAMSQLQHPGGLRPDLILLDLKMAGMGGLEFLSALRGDESLCCIPVAVISTSSLPADVESAYRAGAAGYLLKLVDMNEFSARLKRLLDYWFGLVVLPGEVS